MERSFYYRIRNNQAMYSLFLLSHDNEPYFAQTRAFINNTKPPVINKIGQRKLTAKLNRRTRVRMFKEIPMISALAMTRAF